MALASQGDLPDNGYLPDASPPDEFTYLISKSDESASDGARIWGTDFEHSWGKQALAELWILIKSSVPIILAYMLQMSLQTVTVIIVGHSSPLNLAASAFSFMFALVSGWVIAMGGTTALDTLASSAYTGSQNKHDLGVLLQRAFLVLGVFYIPIAVLWACSEPIFRTLGQDPELSYHSSRFLTCLIPGGLGYIYFEIMKKYLQAQGIMRAGTYVLIITSPLNAALVYLFCYTLDIGLLGAPLAANISYWLSFILLVIYSKYVAGSECWGGWSRDAFKNLWTFSRLALLGILQVGTEWWAAEIMALVAGRLGRTSLATQSVIMTVDQFLSTIPFGVGVASSSRVGNLLGSRDAKGAARAAHMGPFLTITFGTVVLVVLLATRNHFAEIFNHDPAVVELTAQIIPILSLFQIADGINASSSGALRGMGRQHLCAGVNIVTFYCFALPLGIWLAYHGWGLKGLWIGFCAALWSAGILEWIIVACTRWEKEVSRTFRRMDSHDTTEVEYGTEATV